MEGNASVYHVYPVSRTTSEERAKYVMKHVWISADLRGGARRIKRRSAGSIWQGTAFRLPETSKSPGTPQIVFSNLDILIDFYQVFVRCFVRKKMARYSTNLGSSTTAVAATARTKPTSAPAPQQR